MIGLRRRRKPAPAQVTDVAEAEIAVGALSGVAPSQIQRHALVVLAADGTLHMSGTCCKNEAPELLLRAMQLAMDAYAAPGPCEHGQRSAAGHWEGR